MTIDMTKGCVAINYKQKGRYSLRKGMVLAKQPPTNICHEFEANVKILHHHTTIKIGYDAFINCGMLREPVKFTGLYDLDKKELQTVRSGDNIIIKMRFSRSLNYIEVGQQLAFREGQTKGVGVVIHLLPY
jgi:GTPase